MISYLHSDHLNTPRLATNSNQTTVWRWESTAFGAGKAELNPDGDKQKVVINLRFPGQYYDSESGLHYNYYRDYDPRTGRYIQSDPIGLAGGLNTYAYVGGNPIKYIDPLGLQTTMVCRPVQHSVLDFFSRVTGKIMHCAVVVWHWEEPEGAGCGVSGQRKKVIDRQFSLAANTRPFPQGSKSPTYVEDTKSFYIPGEHDKHYDIDIPVPFSPRGFDQQVIDTGDNYSQGPYDGKFGPNSNTAADNIIEGAGGVAPDVDGALHQNHGEGFW